MKPVLISDKAYKYLCEAARKTKETTGKMPSFDELIDEIIEFSE